MSLKKIFYVSTYPFEHMDCSCNSCFNVLVCYSNTCVSSRLILMDCFFSPYYELYFLAWQFLSDARHCDFYIVGCWIFFCIPINILELLPAGIQLSYLEILLIFWVLLLRFTRQDWSRAQSRANFPPRQSQSLLCAFPNAPWIMQFPSLSFGNRCCS